MKSIRLGIKETLPRWAWIEAPVLVVEAAKGTLHGEPAEWKVSRITNFAGRDHEIVVLTDERQRVFVCLAARDMWVRLNERRGMSAVSDLMKGYLGNPADLTSVKRLENWIEYCAFVYKGPNRVVLSKNFLKEMMPHMDAWLSGVEKDREQLVQLHADPVVAIDGDIARIVCNVLCGTGAAEKWEFEARIDKGISISNIEVSTIKEPGTFSWGLY